MNKNFAVIGAAGFVAPRHLKAIKETGNNILVALDNSDSVGILDSYSTDIHFFTEFERFDRHIDKLKRQGTSLDYVSICSPNYLHDSHIRYALRSGADAVCEKPLVLTPKNIDALEEMEKQTGKNVYGILQLRLHDAIKAIKEKVDREYDGEKVHISLKYITTRGNWYHYSWKGDIEKSGGIAANLGIHFFDMLLWIFGSVKDVKIFQANDKKIKGYFELEKANVDWTLSLDKEDLPESAVQKGDRTYRSMKINGHEVDFTSGFTDLHTLSYQEILNGNGFRLHDMRPSVELAYKIRKMCYNNGI